MWQKRVKCNNKPESWLEGRSMKRILTIQDLSCYGQSSLGIALPILSAFGFETAVLPSSILSNQTTGFADFTTFSFTRQMKEILQMWKANGFSFEALYTGYIADPEQFEIILQTRTDFLQPGGLFIVDPAMADHGSLYPGLGQDVVNGMKSLCSKADLILPNLTEACLLLGMDYKEDYPLSEVEEMAKRLCSLGAKRALITSVWSDGKIGSAGYDSLSDTTTSFFMDPLPVCDGTGDLFSSLMVSFLMNGFSLKDSIEKSSLFVKEALEITMREKNHAYGVEFEAVLSDALKKAGLL